LLRRAPYLGDATQIISLLPINNCPSPIIPPEGYQLAVLSQNLLAAILVFFIGLALRNYFKIK